jgi:hypothetical protein
VAIVVAAAVPIAVKVAHSGDNIDSAGSSIYYSIHSKMSVVLFAIRKSSTSIKQVEALANELAHK